MPCRVIEFFSVASAAEADLLYLKLSEHCDAVDHFFITECDRTLQDRSKPFFFDTILETERFQRFRHKITYERLSGKKLGFVAAQHHSDDAGKHNEHLQRGALYRQCRSTLKHDDVVFASDVDEILDRHEISRLVSVFDSNPLVGSLRVPLLYCLYDFNNVCEAFGCWSVYLHTVRSIDDNYEGNLNTAKHFRHLWTGPYLPKSAPHEATKYILPTRFRPRLAKRMTASARWYLKRLLRKVGLTTDIGFLPREDPVAGAFFGWHFSYVYPDVLDHFRKFRSFGHSRFSDPALLGHQLECMKDNRLALPPEHGPQPSCKRWHLDARYFPAELVRNSGRYLTEFHNKIAAYDVERLEQELAA